MTAEPLHASSGLARRAPRYQLMRAVFLRALAGVYLAAFVSLAVQIVGLVGEDGILPLRAHLDAAFRAHGAEAYWLWPTLCWFSPTDGFLQALAWGGAVVSLLVVVGVAPLLGLIVAWVFYLSLSVAGQDFLYFQWDILLLETGLLAILFAPSGLRPRLATQRRAPDGVRWLLWLLLFKLMFLSGITKILSGDPVWANSSALSFHYETQPIPAWTSWYAHQLPASVQTLSVFFMWFAELVAPFAIFAPARLRGVRWAGCAVMAAFQLGIAATGNYGFFNLLTLVLCASLLDDDVWARCLRRSSPESEAPPASGWARALRAAVVAVILPLSLLSFTAEMGLTPRRAAGSGSVFAWTGAFVEAFRPLRSVSGYGLFRVMTTERPELSIEGRTRGGEWVAYRFRWKAGPLDRAPGFAGPHMPRLDWQMWFAALDPSRQERWLISLARHLLEGTPAVRSLLADGPFGEEPPDEVRFVIDRYSFTRVGDEAGGANWWRRERVGELTGPLSRESFRTRRRGAAPSGRS